MARRTQHDLRRLASHVAHRYLTRPSRRQASTFSEVEAWAQESPEAFEAVLTLLGQNGTVTWRDGAFYYTQETR